MENRYFSNANRSIVRYIYNDMGQSEPEYLSRRFQEIMDVAYRQGTVTAADLERHLAGNPSNSTVRTQLRVLVERGQLIRFEKDGQTTYRPARPKQNAAVAAMTRFLNTFVDGSAEKALGTLLTAKDADLSDEDLARLQLVIEAARKEKQK
jgi:predicted transcriptional regulator